MNLITADMALSIAGTILTDAQMALPWPLGASSSWLLRPFDTILLVFDSFFAF